MTSLAALVLILAAAPAARAQDPDIRLSPSSVDFGKVRESKSKQVRIQNKGAADLVITSVALCADTSPEFDFGPLPGTIGPKKKATLEVTYAPADEGSDTGCLVIASNDPDEGEITLCLSGSAKAAAPGGDVLRLRPSSLNFGDIVAGSTLTLDIRVESRGQTLPEAVVNRCFETSDEFTFAPQEPFLVAPGNRGRVNVTYSPVDLGSDEGCLEIRSGNDGDEPALLSLRGNGAESVDGVDLDIHDFKVKRTVKVDRGQKTKVELWVKNPGTVDEARTAEVVGEQNGDIVYQEALSVRDRVGNEGVTKHTFPSFLPTEAGDILWTATIADDDPDEDRRLAVTHASEKATASTGVDLDIRRFNVTKSVILGQRFVRLRLKVRNNGTVDEERIATVIGMQNGLEVYLAELPVSDSVGERGSTVYKFPNFAPAAVGDILWLIAFEDDDDDVDEALAVTLVTAGD